MVRLLIGASVLVVLGGLIIAIAVRRGQRLRDVYRHEGGKLVVVAEALVLLGVVLAFLMFMIVNNR